MNTFLIGVGLVVTMFNGLGGLLTYVSHRTHKTANLLVYVSMLSICFGVGIILLGVVT